MEYIYTMFISGCIPLLDVCQNEEDLIWHAYKISIVQQNKTGVRVRVHMCLFLSLLFACWNFMLPRTDLVLK